MKRRKFSRNYYLETVRLVGQRSAAVAQAARDLDFHEIAAANPVTRKGSGVRSNRVFYRSVPRSEQLFNNTRTVIIHHLDSNAIDPR